MGQKIHPIGFRLAVNRNWSSRWYADDKQFGGMLTEDIRVREYLKKKLKNASVGRVVIERPAKNARITIFSARPGVVIGKRGEDIESLKSDLQRLMGVPVHVNIEEIRRAMKRAMQNAMRLGAQGIKIMSSGRLNGIEIARTEWYREGRVPLHTLRANIDYGTSEAQTTYGIIGIKVWVYKGDMLPNGEYPAETAAPREDERRPRRPRGERPDGRRPGGRGGRGPRKDAGAPAAAAPAASEGE
jgi:small subunit ribosomal protein S3